MQNSRLFSIASRLRPRLAQLEGMAQLVAFLEIVPLLFTGPLALAGMVWLVAVTDLDVLADHATLTALLLVLHVIMDRQQFIIFIETPDGQDVPTSGSLAGLLMWGACLVYGPSLLWIVVVTQVIVTAEQAYQRYQMGMNVSWSPLSTISQTLTSGVFVILLSLGVYRLAGGDYPLAGLKPGDVAPALLATVVSVVLTHLFVYPLVRTVNTIMGTDARPEVMRQWWLTVWALSLLSQPFGVFGALSYSEGSQGLFVAFAAGIALVNFLARLLSRANNRSRQRSREMARLEALGEAIIQAPPDMHTLGDLLREHVGTMFPNARAVITLFDAPPGETLPHPVAPFTLGLPPTAPLPEDGVWDRLRASPEPHIIERNVKPPDMPAVFGHALVVKIMNTSPDDPAREPACLGAVYVLRHKSARAEDALAAVQALASTLESALYRARAHVETLAHQKVAQELEFAGRIQASFLPERVPAIEGWDIAAALVPARQTSGDFYDFVPLGEGCLGMIVADVADKGTGAALYMALSRTLIRTYAMQHPSEPADALRLANERLLTDAQSDQFVTVFYGVIDAASGLLTYANAGHNPGYVLGGNGATDVQALTKTGIPLGMFDGVTWEQKSVALAAGDTLVLYTDGVSEAQNAEQAEFGEDRLVQIGTAHRSGPASALHTALMEAVTQFVGGAPQFDDITLLVARRL